MFEVEEVKKEEGIKEPTEQGMVQKPKEEDKKVKIIIEEQEGDENSGDVFVSVNGYGMTIKRGFPVEIPESFVDVLRKAVITKMTQDKETDEIKYRDVPRFNFRIVNE
jgi:hypothetical protein